MNLNGAEEKDCFFPYKRQCRKTNKQTKTFANCVISKMDLMDTCKTLHSATEEDMGCL